MSVKPLVSVLVTAYNREQYIAEAIQSVIDSTYNNWELIVVDDNSSDKTVLIAKEFEKKDSRIRVYVNEKNIGQFANRNKAASYATGKYLKYLDSDDQIIPDGLEYCVTNMEKNPTASVGMITYKKKYGSLAIKISSQEIIRNHFSGGSDLTIGPTGSIFKRARFEEVGGFDPRFQVAADNHFNIKMALVGDVVLFPYKFFYYRRHDGQEIHNQVGYLIYNFLYNKELFQSKCLPLSENETAFLEQKLQKRHAVNLTRYLFTTGKIKSVVAVMKATHYSPIDWMRGFFY